jgi:hypothetical protein
MSYNILNNISKNKNNKLLMEKLRNIDVLIYCGGKCGGSTLKTTFTHNNYITLHIHSNYCFQTTILQNNNTSIFDIINYNMNKKRVYIIDSYRTPIERKISSFFQNIHINLSDYENYTINELIDIFNERFFYDIENYHSIDEVFNHYSIPHFTEFDFDKKYNILHHNNITLIKIRFNEIGIWDKILSEIFQKKITIVPDNLTETKKINDIYNKFKNEYRIPDNYLDVDIHNDVNFKIYNNDNEQKKYLEKWNLRRISLQKKTNNSNTHSQTKQSGLLKQLNNNNNNINKNLIILKNLNYLK